MSYEEGAQIGMYRQYGFIAPRGGIATTAEEAASLAAEIGFPVAMKIVSPDILHKTDVGGVELGCATEEEVKAAFSRIGANVRQRAPEARIEGISVEEMVREGVEVILGLIRDPQFGPSIMFGLGGVFTEVLQDVSFRVLPITPDDARAMLREIKGRPLLQGYRGQQPVSEELLVDLLMKLSRMGLDLGDRLESVDLNPVVVWGDQHRVLDAKVLLQPVESAKPVAQPNLSHLDGFFSARSVAVVGASATWGKVGNSVLDSLANHEYVGKVYPVNPTKAEIMGLKCYPSISAIPEPVELVTVAVALSAVPDLVRECGARGIHNMVIHSGGGKELGGESQELEATIKRLARENDVRIVGCNCIGVYDAETKLDTLFQVHERMVRPKKGPIAVLSQSGTVGAAVVESLADVGVSRFVSYGNRIDVDEADLITYLVEDPDTRVIAIYVEGLAEGQKFLAAARRVTPRKPIVLFKSGRSQRAARASISHTGFFGGSYGVAAGAFRQAGIIAVDSCEELSAVARALAMQPRARGSRLAMISNGAGTMVQAMDLMEGTLLSMPALADETVAALKKVYPPFYLVQNPVDVTGSATAADYEVGIQALLDDPNVDIVMPWFVFQDTALEESIVEVLGRASEQRKKPILCGSMGGPFTESISRAIQDRGVPMYHSVREWVAAAKGIAR
ncbi:MAG: acetate--CoA ligase family protein [Sphingomonadaceae bacterium]